MVGEGERQADSHELRFPKRERLCKSESRFARKTVAPKNKSRADVEGGGEEGVGCDKKQKVSLKEHDAWKSARRGRTRYLYGGEKRPD